MCNASLQEGLLPVSHAIITPLLKKQSLDPTELKNYRAAVSNLTFMSKSWRNWYLKASHAICRWTTWCHDCSQLIAAIIQQKLRFFEWYLTPSEQSTVGKVEFVGPQRCIWHGWSLNSPRSFTRGHRNRRPSESEAFVIASSWRRSGSTSSYCILRQFNDQQRWSTWVSSSTISWRCLNKSPRCVILASSSCVKFGQSGGPWRRIQ